MKGGRLKRLYFLGISCFPCHNIPLVIMDVWIPFERSSEGMKDADKARSKVFGLVKLEEHTQDDIPDRMEQAVKE